MTTTIVAATTPRFGSSTAGTNMHRLWDSDMIERVSKDEDFWLTDLAALDTP